MKQGLAASILARLANDARGRGEDFQVVLARFGVERLLYRLSISPNAEEFVLKGAQLLFARAEERYRPTRDLDLLGLGTYDELDLEKTFRDLCQIQVNDDALVFDAASLRAEAIRATTEDPGFRARMTANLGRARIPIQVDIGFGDVITPGPVEIEYPSLLGMARPKLKAYPLETVVAEKLEILTSLGVFTSRLKDLYDLWRIKNLFDLETKSLATAIDNTFQRRGTALDQNPEVLTRAFYTDPAKIRLWRSFVERANLTAPPLNEVCDELADWLASILGEQR